MRSVHEAERRPESAQVYDMERRLRPIANKLLKQIDYDDYREVAKSQMGSRVIVKPIAGPNSEYFAPRLRVTGPDEHFVQIIARDQASFEELKTRVGMLRRARAMETRQQQESQPAPLSSLQPALATLAH